ncbi:ATP-binding protein [Streptomyces sp. NPDC055005]
MEREWLSRRNEEAERAAPGGFDLEQCVREPIHLLGGVQSYGALLAVDPADGRIEVASDNLASLLGLPPEPLVGTPVTGIVSREDFREALESTEGQDGPASILPVVIAVDGRDRNFDLSAHRRDGLLVLELEPRDATGPFDFTVFYQGVRRALARLRSAGSVTECCDIAVREVRRLTGFDRVVAYRFDGDDGPGEVIAEALAPGWEPWLGLWFPATDIPPQARRLYLENWIRVICDVEDDSARLVPEVRAATGRPLDLSGSALRTVSGFHLEYLRNIGVRSSMSVSVVRDGRLWGLIACHGGTPAVLGPELRSACELFGSAFSLRLDVVEEREQARSLESARRELTRAAHFLDPAMEDELPARRAALEGLLGADGLLVSRGGKTTGTTPHPDVTDHLARRASELTPGTVWATDRLPEELGPQERDPADGATPAGVLMIPLGGGDFIAWTRRERPLPRQWAADPATPVRTGPRGERLTPRGSGAVFRATVRGRSLPWTPVDLAVARELRQLLTGLVLRHATALGLLNEELRMTNIDLDSFAHVAAHDLKEPLRGISNAATFILEDAGPNLDEQTVRRLHTMHRLTGRMDELLNSLLHYARLGRSGLRRTRTDLDAVLDAALEIAGPRLAEQHVRLVRPAALPTLDADPDRVTDILVNLLVNSAKYADPDRRERRVEISVVDATPPGSDRAEQTITVADNGIGIPADRHDEVFDLFRRLHGPSEHGGGTGVGLAVVKRVVERHGGRLWLESAPGEGTTFFFTLGPAAADVTPGRPE